MQSATVHLPGIDRFIILSDTRIDFSDVELCATVLDCSELGVQNLENMKLWYTIIEFNTSIKPYSFLHLFTELAYDEVCYIDPDILLFDAMTEVFDALQHHSCVLTPHMFDPLQDGKEPSDLTIMKSGVYNLGFLGLRNDKDGIRLAKWWSDRCFLHCRVDIQGHMFTDQRWMDLAPVLVANPFILRHPGYNVAYWNLLHRKIARDSAGTWWVDGKRLVFFHFSGINPDKPEQFSKHQNRLAPDNLGIVNDLCDLYRNLVLENKWRRYSPTPYGFATFPDGRRIDDVMRHWVLRSADDKLIDPSVPLSYHSDFLDGPEETSEKGGPILTRYMHQLWLDRRDLRGAFDILTSDGKERYLNWFVDGDAVAQGVDKRSIAAAQRLNGDLKAHEPKRSPLRKPPWPPVCKSLLAGNSTEALAGLAKDVTINADGTMIFIPKQAAILWETRRDLQDAFDLTKVGKRNDFLCWILTSGLTEHAVDAASFSPEFFASVCELSSLSAFYADVPITRGMILLRRVDMNRDSLSGWQSFPIEPVGRLAHGVWFAFLAPRLFGWPDAFVNHVKAFFHEPTAITTDGFQLNRLAISIWEMRPDLQRAYRLDDNLSIWKYLEWLLIQGLRELGLTLNEFDPRLQKFLLSESPRFDGVTQLVELMHSHRRDLQQMFDLSAAKPRRDMIAWAQRHMRDEIGPTLLEALLLTNDNVKTELKPLVHRTNIALTGYWTSPSGRGEDVRSSAWALDAIGYRDYIIIDLGTGDFIKPGGLALVSGCEINVKTNIVHTNADTALSDALLLRKLGVTSKRVIGFWAWELEWLPEYWAYSYSFYDTIWASTRFAERAFARDGVRPVMRMPMSVVAPAAEMPFSRRDLALPEEATVFLFMFDYRSYAARKNPEAVIRAFIRAFPNKKKPVYLLIKTSGAEANPEEAARLARLANDHRIEFRDVVLTRPELIGLVQAADAFVSLHRSEGFGRGPAEAMLLGVPVIITDYSGSVDYATSECALLVDYELLPVGDDEYPGVAGQSWADANVGTAALHMQWIHEHPAEASALGSRGRDRIYHLYNERTVGKALLAGLELCKKLPVRKKDALPQPLDPPRPTQPRSQLTL